MQHIGGHGILVARVADAHADPPIGLANMFVQRPQPVVPGMSAALLQPQLAGGQVKLVMEHRHVRRGQLEEPHRLAHRLPRQVHEGAGFQQDDPVISQPAICGHALKGFAPRRETVICSKPVHGHEADVVPVARIFRPGIAKAHE